MTAPTSSRPLLIRMHPNDNVNTVLAMPDVDRQFDGFGVEDGGGKPEQYGQFTRTEIAKWAKVAKDAKVSIES